MNVFTFKEGLANGPFTWPGAYASLLMMADGEWMCYECAVAQQDEIITAIQDNDRNSSWMPEVWYVYWEGPVDRCCQCNKELPSEYGDPEALSN